jgi:hypothetical protein
MTRLGLVLALCTLVLGVSPARGVVEAEMPLVQLVRDSQIIAIVRLERLDHENGKAMMAIERTLRGERFPAAIPTRLIAAAGGDGNPSDMLDRVEEGMTFVLFLAQTSSNDYQIFAYSAGSWFKLQGLSNNGRLQASFVQGEPYLRRTYRGEVAELAEMLDHFLAGTGELPGIDKAIKPGLGPTLNAASGVTQVEPPTSSQVELGPAWRIDHEQMTEPSGSTFLNGNHAVAAALVIAAVGLLLMITRSSRETT